MKRFLLLVVVLLGVSAPGLAWAGGPVPGKARAVAPHQASKVELPYYDIGPAVRRLEAAPPRPAFDPAGARPAPDPAGSGPRPAPDPAGSGPPPAPPRPPEVVARTASHAELQARLESRLDASPIVLSARTLDALSEGTIASAIEKARAGSGPGRTRVLFEDGVIVARDPSGKTRVLRGQLDPSASRVAPEQTQKVIMEGLIDFDGDAVKTDVITIPPTETTDLVPPSELRIALLAA